MSDISLMINVTRQQQVEIEEHCINLGLSISEYLLGLHKTHQSMMLAQPSQNFSKFMEESKQIIEENREAKSDENSIQNKKKRTGK
jgi:hypothetical protein